MEGVEVVEGERRLARSREQCPSSDRQVRDQQRRQSQAPAAPRFVRDRHRHYRRRDPRARRQPPIAHDAEQRHVARQRELGTHALGREHEHAVRRRRQLCESGQRQQREQQGALGAESRLQLRPPGMRVDLCRMCRLGAGGDNEHASHLMRSLVQRDPILERVDDAFGRMEPGDLVERGGLEAQIHECDASAVACGDAGDVPGGFCRPRRIARQRHEGDECRIIHQRRDKVTEPRERQLADAGHCPGW